MGVYVAAGSGVRETCNPEPRPLPSDLPPPPELPECRDICAFRHVHCEHMFLLSLPKAQDSLIQTTL